MCVLKRFLFILAINIPNKSAALRLNESHIKFNDVAVFQNISTRVVSRTSCWISRRWMVWAWMAWNMVQKSRDLFSLCFDSFCMGWQVLSHLKIDLNFNPTGIVVEFLQIIHHDLWFLFWDGGMSWYKSGWSWWFIGNFSLSIRPPFQESYVNSREEGKSGVYSAEKPPEDLFRSVIFSWPPSLPQSISNFFHGLPVHLLLHWVCLFFPSSTLALPLYHKVPFFRWSLLTQDTTDIAIERKFVLSNFTNSMKKSCGV